MQDLSKVLNFVGALLNFLAGVMLAPEAIGIERIRKLEHKTEVASKSILIKIENAYGFIHSVGQRLEINPFNPRVAVVSIFIYIPIAYITLKNMPFISAWIQYIFLCLFNPLYATQSC